MKKRILALSISAAVVISLVASGTWALFTDTEGPAPVTITAGTVDIAVGPGGDMDFENPWMGKFDIPDIKPCETHWIEFVIKNVGTNPVVVWKGLVNPVPGDGPELWPPDGMFQDISPICSSEPEFVASSGTFTGGVPNPDSYLPIFKDIASLIIYDMHVLVLPPADGPFSQLLAPGPLTNDENKWWQMQFHDDQGFTMDNLFGDTEPQSVILGSIPPGGTMHVWQSYHLSPDAGNEYQGDCLSFDIALFAQQVEGTQMLMENKIQHPDDWLIVFDDDGDGILSNNTDSDTFGTLDYNSTGPTFDYTFNGHHLERLAGDVEYSLVWYKEGYTAWSGEVEVIDSSTASGGELTLTGSHDFNANLVGAKIWLVPSSYISNDKITNWTMDNFLFETHIIYYEDTNITP